MSTIWACPLPGDASHQDMIPDTSPFGAIDVIGDGHVQGWAFDPGHPADRLRVIVLLDGEIAGFDRADRVRNDLVADDIGDGAYGFRCRVPDLKLDAASVVTVLAEESQGLVLIAERELAPRAASAGRRRGPAVHFDITDLLDFMVHHREVSGIQRVQCGYLVNVLALAKPGLLVRVCALLPGMARYVELDPAAVGAFLLGFEAWRELTQPAWAEHVQALRLGNGGAPDFRRDDVLLILGASWARDGCYRAVAEARRAHGVFFVQMFHDLIPTLLPEMVPPDLIGGFNQAMAGMLGCADHILANSAYSRQDLLKACEGLGVAGPPVGVIPLGATLDYRQDSVRPAPPPEDGRPSPRARFGDYVLCVGTVEPRKNVAYLATIWGRMLASGEGPVPKLVCVGRMSGMNEALSRLLKASDNLDGHFVHLSDVGDDDLKRLYRDCLFTVFPSIYEGWGLPVAESLLFGKICVSSNATSMPEVGGDWAVYIDPHNVNDGHRVISSLLADRAGIAAREQALREGYRPITWRDATTRMMGLLVEAHAALVTRRGAVATASALPVLQPGRLCSLALAEAKGGALCGLGDAIGQHKAGRLRLGADWHGLEFWGSWSCGTEARLGFSVTAPAGAALVCYLGLRLPYYVLPVACRVLLDGRDVGGVMLDGKGDRDVRIDLPPGMADIRITLRLMTLPVPLPDIADQRQLGIGVRHVYVCEAADTEARLAYFDRQMVAPLPTATIHRLKNTLS